MINEKVPVGRRQMETIAKALGLPKTGLHLLGDRELVGWACAAARARLRYREAGKENELMAADGMSNALGEELQWTYDEHAASFARGEPPEIIDTREERWDQLFSDLARVTLNVERCREEEREVFADLERVRRRAAERER